MNFSNFIDYYKLLGINEDATMEEIKKAYLKKVRQYHPDNNISKTPEEKKEIEIKFKQIQEAYSILKSEDKKIPYDNFRNKYYAVKDAKRKREEEKRKAWEQEQEEKRRAWEQEQEARREQAEQEAKRKAWEQEEKRKAWEQEQEEKRRAWEQEQELKRKQAEQSATIFNNIKQDYKDIRKEEKTHSFLRRHKYLDKKFKENLGPYFDLNDNKDVIVFNFYRGVVHALKESFYHLKKATYITKDSIPRYIIRNRRTFGTIIAAGILASQLLSPNAPERPNPIASETPITYESYLDSRLLLIRNHTLKAGDTLSQLAEDAGISTLYLANLNDLDVNQIIQWGATIIIPYDIDKEDLDYYRTPITIDPNTSIEEILSTYETDISTLLMLNPDTIIVNPNSPNTYTIITNTIYVPNFINKQDLEAKKNFSIKA